MKKLLLFALPICLLTGFAVRAENTQPTEQAVAQDKDIIAFEAIMKDVSKDCQAEIASIQAKLTKAFEGEKMNIILELAKKYPGSVIKLDNGDEFFAFGWISGMISLPKAN